MSTPPRCKSLSAARIGFVARKPVTPGFRKAQRFASPVSADHLEPRHLQDLQRPHHLLDVDVRRVFQFAHGALGQRPQPFGQLAQLQPPPRARRGDHVLVARRMGRSLPAVVTLPAGNIAVGNADLLADLAIAEAGGFDEPAHLGDGQVAVHSPQARRPVAVDRGWPLGRFVRFHAKAGEGRRRARQDHDAEYNPTSLREQEGEG
ncbi:hypothetical protein [Nitrobacter sp. TKz-YC02]|uniref:hypothetical protein n=1 Tax=Nitrobacter sp. TKz-YC02 TaxID=3398704 RepID=UPI003CF4A348